MSMSPEREAAYNAMVKRVNGLSDEELDHLIKQDQCPFEPEHLIGVPLGMFHCQLCGEMVLAGVPHVRQRDLEEGLADMKPGVQP